MIRKMSTVYGYTRDWLFNLGLLKKLRAERYAMVDALKVAAKERLTAAGVEDAVQAGVFAEMKYLVGVIG